jgi:hypothetical protein
MVYSVIETVFITSNVVISENIALKDTITWKLCSEITRAASLPAARGAARRDAAEHRAAAPAPAQRAVHPILSREPDNRASLPWWRQHSGHRMYEEVLALIHSICVTIVKLVPVWIALGAAFAVLSFFWVAIRAVLVAEARTGTDLCYWFVSRCWRATCASGCWCSGRRCSSASPPRTDSSRSMTTAMDRWRCRWRPGAAEQVDIGNGHHAPRHAVPPGRRRAVPERGCAPWL